MNNNTSESSINSDIDIYYLYKILLKKKILISALAFISFLIASLISLTLKRTWEGRFEIVISNSEGKNDSNLMLNNNFAGLRNLTSIRNNLKTEIGIIQSPSVLMPIFNYVGDQKIKENPNFKNKSFFSWRNSSLNINLNKDTSILNIAYKDQDKELILPVLEKISNTYKDYSTQKKRKSIKSTLIFLEDQISLYKVKSLNSFKKAQKFALANNLIYSAGKDDVVPKIEFERYQSKQNLRSLKSQLDGIRKLKNNADDNEELSRIISGYDFMENQELSKLDSQIKSNKEKYKENDIVIKRLNKKKSNLIKLLIKKEINALEAKIFTLANENKANLLEEDKLIKFKELTTNANRDQLTLNNLEDLYTQTKFDQAKLKDPWQLITTPTLLKNPVGRSRKTIALLGAFMGLITGIIYSLWDANKKDKIFFDFQLMNLFPNNSFFKLDFDNEEKIIIFLKDLILLNPKKDILILDLLHISNDLKEKIKQIIVKNDMQSNIKIDSELKNNDESKLVFLLFQLGEITNKEIDEIKSRLNLYKTNIYGILIIT